MIMNKERSIGTIDLNSTLANGYKHLSHLVIGVDEDLNINDVFKNKQIVDIIELEADEHCRRTIININDFEITSNLIIRDLEDGIYLHNSDGDPVIEIVNLYHENYSKILILKFEDESFEVVGIEYQSNNN